MKTELSILWSLLWRAVVWLPAMLTLVVIVFWAQMLAVFIPLLVFSGWFSEYLSNDRFYSHPATVAGIWLIACALAWFLRRFSLFHVRIPSGL
jgi:hypothetical protein